MSSMNLGMSQAAAAKATERADSLAELLFWSAALMETLVLVGGLMWIMSGPGAISTWARVALVVVGSVLSGGAIAWSALRRFGAASANSAKSD